MEQHELRKRVAAQLQQTPLPPLEAAKRFLQTYCYDALSLAEVHALLQERARVNTRPLESGLQGIEGVLAAEYPEGTLLDLVMDYGNYMPDEHSDAGARAWLQQITELIRSSLVQA